MMGYGVMGGFGGGLVMLLFVALVVLAIAGLVKYLRN